jgi:hypothetical protein
MDEKIAVLKSLGLTQRHLAQLYVDIMRLSEREEERVKNFFARNLESTPPD